MGETCSTHGTDDKCTQYFGWKHDGKRSLERSRCRWEDVSMDFRQIGSEVVGRMHLVQDRDQWRTVVKAIMNLRVPWKAGNFLTS